MTNQFGLIYRAGVIVQPTCDLQVGDQPAGHLLAGGADHLSQRRQPLV